MHDPSVKRARYILSLLRVARDADAQVATRLLKALSSEYRYPDTPIDLMPFEMSAIDAIQGLASALSFEDKVKSSLWERAGAAATDWLNAAS